MDSTITAMDCEPTSFSSSPSFQQDPFPLLELPPLVLVIILGSLSAQDLVSAGQSCSPLWGLSQHNGVWKRVAKRRWGLKSSSSSKSSRTTLSSPSSSASLSSSSSIDSTTAGTTTASAPSAPAGPRIMMRPARWKHYYAHKLAVMREGAFKWENVEMEGDPITKRYQHTGSAVGKDVYFIGGQELPERRFDEIFVLHTDTSKIEKVNPVSGIPPKFARHTAVTIGEKVYLFGGFDGVSRHFHLSVFDSTTTEWTSPKPAGIMPPSRTNHSAVAVGTQMYIFGGMYKDASGAGSDKLIFLNDMHVLSTEGGLSWKKMPQRGQIPSPRCGHRMVAFGNFLVLFGGGCGEQWDSKFSDVYVYDTTTYEWVKPAITGHAPVCTFTVAFSAGVFLFIFGGQSLNDNNLTNELYCLDTVSMTWTNVATAGIKPGARDMASGNVVGSAMYMFGGYCGNAINSLYKLEMDPEIAALPSTSLSPFA